jgi:hypothetical protein
MLRQFQVATFSHESAPEIPEGAAHIRDRLLAGSEPAAEVLADEWVFITSQSIAIAVAVRKAAKKAAKTTTSAAKETVTSLEAFGRAGAKVYRLKKTQMERALQAVRDRIPRHLK